MKKPDDISVPYNVFIDLDKTILSLNSGTILVKKAHKDGLMRTRDLLNGLYLSILYKMEWRDTRKIINAMAMWMKGLSEEVFSEFATGIVQDHLIDLIRPDMHDEIAFHQSKGARIVMLSAALSYICDPIGEFFKMDHIISSHLEVKDGLFTGRPIGRLCFGVEKLNSLKSFCKDNPCELLNDYYYADSISDLHVLKVVGHPVCVDPDKRLARYAKRHNWRVIS
ncbi:MAG: HAD-IB family hydrolase [Bacteroidales bacterium]|nr:HAD-IB family hydrolase [Bacteroidales bacterium]